LRKARQGHKAVTSNTAENIRGFLFCFWCGKIYFYLRFDRKEIFK